MCSPTQCICAGVTFHQRGILALRIICGTRSPQISACSAWESGSSARPRPARRAGRPASPPGVRRRWTASRVPSTSVARQVWSVPCMPRKSWLRTNSGIGVQDLRSGRRVVHVVEAHQRVAQERRQQRRACPSAFPDRRPAFSMAARRFSLRSRFDVPLGPVAEGQRVLFARGQRGARQLDLGDARGQPVRPARCSASRPCATASRWSASSNSVSSETRRCASKMRDHVLHHLRVRVGIASAAAVPASRSIMRSCGETPAGAWRRQQQLARRCARHRRVRGLLCTLRERRQDAARTRRPPARRECSLPHEDLPQPDQRLHGAGRIGAQRRILDLADGRARCPGTAMMVLSDSVRRFGEQRILRAELR